MKAIHWVILIIGIAAVAAYAVVNRFRYEPLAIGTANFTMRVDSWTGDRCMVGVGGSYRDVRQCD